MSVRACAGTEIPCETDVIDKPSNNAIDNMDFNFAMKKAATKRIKQALENPIMARLNSFRPDSTRRDDT